MMAVDACRPEILKLVLVACDPLDSKDLDELLLNATFRPSPESVSLLLERGANPRAAEGGSSALQRAVMSAKSPEMVRMLVNAGADPDLPNSQGHSPKMLVALMMENAKSDAEKQQMLLVLKALESPED